MSTPPLRMNGEALIHSLSGFAANAIVRLFRVPSSSSEISLELMRWACDEEKNDAYFATAYLVHLAVLHRDILDLFPLVGEDCIASFVITRIKSCCYPSHNPNIHGMDHPTLPLLVLPDHKKDLHKFLRFSHVQRKGFKRNNSSTSFHRFNLFLIVHLHVDVASHRSFLKQVGKHRIGSFR